MFVTATADPAKTLANIKAAQTKLGDLLVQYEIEATKSIGLCSMIEETLKLANIDALEEPRISLPCTFAVQETAN